MAFGKDGWGLFGHKVRVMLPPSDRLLSFCEAAVCFHWELDRVIKTPGYCFLSCCYLMVVAVYAISDIVPNDHPYLYYIMKISFQRIMRYTQNRPQIPMDLDVGQHSLLIQNDYGLCLECDFRPYRLLHLVTVILRFRTSAKSPPQLLVG